MTEKRTMERRRGDEENKTTSEGENFFFVCEKEEREREREK